MTTAASAALSNDLARSWAIGSNLKMQVVTVAVVSGDTGATVTATSMTTVRCALVTGGAITLTAQPTYATNVATLAFSDPAANAFLQVLLLGY